MSNVAPLRKPAVPEPEARTPRGIRNHNPGNVLRSKSVTWRGQAEDQSADAEFVVFTAPEWGLRAIARILLSYRERGVRTPLAIANRWAPPKHRLPDGTIVKNDPDAYGKSIGRALGIAPTDVVDARDPAVMRTLIQSIVQKENGQQPYPVALIDKAMDLAGLDVPGFPPAPQDAA